MNSGNLKSDRVDLYENKPVVSAVFTLALPTILSQIITIIYNFADTYFVGRTENPAAVAAISVCMPIYIIITGLANLFGVGGASVISRALGKKDEKRAQSAFSFSVLASLVSAVLYAVIVFVFNEKIVYFIGADETSFEYCTRYLLYTVCLGSIPTLLSSSISQMIRSVGKAKEAAIGMALGGVMNIALDPLFMFVILPKGYEVDGAAIATLLSNIASFIYFIIVVKRMNEPVCSLSKKGLKLDKSVVYDVVMTGFPASLSTCLAMASNMTANKLISSFGTDAVAGLGIAKKANTLAFNINMGLTQGVLSLVGYNYSSGNFKRMKKVVYFTGAITLGFSLLCVVLYLLFASPIISFFMEEKSTLSYGIRFLRAIAFAVPLCALTYSMNMVFQAAGKKLNSFILSILRKGLLDIPLMIVFKKVFDSAVSIAWATPVAEVLSVGVAFLLFFTFMRKLGKNS